MKTLQYQGPFYANQRIPIELPTTYKILQIGIEHPNSVPILEYENTGVQVKPLFSLDDINYAVMDNDILEFNGLYQHKMTLKILRDVDSYTIINLAFKDVDE